MPQDYSTDLLTGWEDYAVQSVTRLPAQGRRRPVVQIELIRASCTFRCSGCDRSVTHVHEVTRRQVRDLPILDADTIVCFPRYRVACPTCGPKVEALPWLSPWARVTSRLAESIIRLCRILPVQHVADWYGLDWDTVKALDQGALPARLLPVDLSAVEVIALDEFALRKGHGYATVILDPRRKRVLWVGRGRGREDIRPFFQQLGTDGCRRGRATVMDMNAAYECQFDRDPGLECDRLGVELKLGHGDSDLPRLRGRRRPAAKYRDERLDDSEHDYPLHGVRTSVGC